MKKEFKIAYEVIASRNDLGATEKKLYDAAFEARKNAYAAYSDFKVGCALLLDNGEIITGSNQENAAYPSGLCAERTAIFWTSANYPNAKILKMFVIGSPSGSVSPVPIPPCGACRQSILEYEARQKDPIEIYFSSIEGEIIRAACIRDLLPFSFDGSYL